MHRRAHVVDETWKRQRFGAQTAAEAILGLDDADRVAGTCQLDRGREPVRAAADHDRRAHLSEYPARLLGSRRDADRQRALRRRLRERDHRAAWWAHPALRRDR